MRYAILIRLLAPVFFLVLWWRGRKEPAWREDWTERLGRVPARTDRPLWIHAASVGEANSAAGFLRQLREEHPDLPLHLSAFTPTGLQRLRELVPQASHSLLPVDLPAVVRRYVRSIGPRALVVLETEFWPNLLACCERSEVPIYWLSGRLGENSVKRLPGVFGRRRLQSALASVRAFGVQTERDRKRFIALGAPAERIQVAGSLKFDLPIAEDLRARAEDLRQQWQRPLVWLAASTHPGEEDSVLQAHQQLLQQVPDALLLLAPRHPRRAEDVSQLIEEAGLRQVRRSQNQALDSAQVLLVDTLGELMLFYAACDICLVAGSLAPIGGHNLLEPAALSRPILSGPHLDSCRDIADALVGRQALEIVADAAALADALGRFASDPVPWWECGARAAEFAAANRGAVQRSLELLDEVLAANPSQEQRQPR